MKHYLRFGQIGILRVPVYLHWSVILACIAALIYSLNQPIGALLAGSTYLGILFIHEIGHALTARKLRVRVLAVKIGIVHGVCVYEDPNDEWDDVLISWGGVLAQLLVAVPLISVSILVPSLVYGYLNIVVGVLGFINMFIAIGNLLPIQPLDGAKAWRIIPLALRLWKNRD